MLLQVWTPFSFCCNRQFSAFPRKPWAFVEWQVSPFEAFLFRNARAIVPFAILFQLFLEVGT